MSQLHPSTSPKLQIAWPIVLVGGGLGAVLAWGILSGDQQGRVNLIYLLLVYVLLPLLSLIVSSLSMISGRGFNLARLVVALPLWSHQKQMLLRKARQLQVEKYWLFFQSHLAALAFSISSLLVFFILLLATDINFVWRSTLLAATDLHPLLLVIAKPWTFWHEAQPSLALLEMTQDSRLQTTAAGTVFANWWPFVLAVQIFYCVFLRSLLLLVAGWLFRSKLQRDFEQALAAQIDDDYKTVNELVDAQPVVSTLPENIMVNNWAQVDFCLVTPFQTLNLSKDNVLNAGPLASEVEQRVAERWQGQQLVLVKSWEPPMGDLADFLQNGQGYLWPLDWQDEALEPLRKIHLQEWQRFTQQFSNWQIFVPAKLMPKEQA